MNTTDKSSEKIQFPVIGMTCMGCASKVKSALNSIDGVAEVSINLTDSSASVKFDRQQVDPLLLQQAVGAVGYQLIIPPIDVEERPETSRGQQIRKAQGGTIGLAIISISLAMVGISNAQVHNHGSNHWLHWIITIGIVAVVAVSVIAFIRRRRK